MHSIKDATFFCFYCWWILLYHEAGPRLYSAPSELDTLHANDIVHKVFYSIALCLLVHWKQQQLRFQYRKQKKSRIEQKRSQKKLCVWWSLGDDRVEPLPAKFEIIIIIISSRLLHYAKLTSRNTSNDNSRTHNIFRPIEHRSEWIK